MPIKRRPSKWQPGGLELFERAASLYSKEDLDRFAGALSVSETRRRDFDNRIRNVTGWLYVELHYKNRPTSAEKFVAVQTLETSLARAISAIEALDPDSRKLLAEIAAEAPIDQQTESDPGGLFDLGSERLLRSERAVRELHRLTTKLSRTFVKEKGGRTSLAEVKSAIEGLNDIWARFIRKTEQRPSDALPKLKTVDGRKAGDGLDFCRAVLQPVLDHYGIRSNLESPYSEVLYGKNPSRKR